MAFDNLTEYFNGREWKSLSDYNDGDVVLQYEEGGTASLLHPLKYIYYL